MYKIFLINYFLYLPEKVSRDVQLFATDDNNFVTLQDGFCDDAGKSSQKMATAIDKNWL